MTDESSIAESALILALNVARGHGAPPDEITLETREIAPKSASLPPRVLRGHFSDILLAADPAAGLQWLHDSRILSAVLPEVEATVDFAQEMGRRHKDVWKHTKQVVTQSVEEEGIRWAALLHDVGKVPTRELTDDGKVTFHGHAEVGARMFDRIAHRLDFPEPLRSRVRFLIQHHLRANLYDDSWTDSAVRRFGAQMGEHLEDLLALSRADVTSGIQHKRDAAMRRLDALSGRASALRELDARVPPLPSGLGDSIMERFSLRPSRLIGQLKGELEQSIAEGKLEPQRDADYYLDYLEQHSQLLPEE